MPCAPPRRVFSAAGGGAAGLADAVMPFDAVMTEFTDALAAKQRLAQPGGSHAPRREACPLNPFQTRPEANLSPWRTP